MSTTTIRPKERDAVIQCLQAGVVPRAGQHHIQVGRAQEVAALLRDVERIADGGSAFRFVIGHYGCGKTFFLHLVRSIALEKKLVTIHADLAPDRRLQATGGQARSLYAELMHGMATRAKPDGGALPSVVERFVGSAATDGKARGVPPEAVIQERLAALTEQVGGYDFAQVVGAYWRAHDQGDDTLKANAIRWLRGEFSTKTDARSALGVRTIVDDAAVYDHLKLMARFVRLAGYAGLLVGLDEMVNIYKLSQSKSRGDNYEQILRMLNDCLQGTAAGLGFLMGGTPEFLLDPRRGMYSYEALQSRLAENPFATDGRVDFFGPVLRLANLTPEDFYVLITKVRHVYAGGEEAKYLIPDEALQAFMAHCSSRLGEALFRTPRTVIREFVNLLAVLEQNPGLNWQTVLPNIVIQEEKDPDLELLGDDQDSAGSGSDDELSSFRL
ncbi:MAG: ATP-binding protein [Vicinamibacteria bacterium]